MHELSQRSYPSDGILSVYDLILIPKWVMEEIEDSTYRSTYVEQLQAQGYLLDYEGVSFRRNVIVIGRWCPNQTLSGYAEKWSKVHTEFRQSKT